MIITFGPKKKEKPVQSNLDYYTYRWPDDVTTWGTPPLRLSTASATMPIEDNYEIVYNHGAYYYYRFMCNHYEMLNHTESSKEYHPGIKQTFTNDFNIYIDDVFRSETLITKIFNIISKPIIKLYNFIYDN